MHSYLFANLNERSMALPQLSNIDDPGGADRALPTRLANMPAEQAAFLLNITRAEALKAYDLLALRVPSGLIDNIMRLGLEQAQQRVFNGQEGCAAGKGAQPRDKGDKE